MDLYEIPFPIEDYCQAIGYRGPLNNSAQVVFALARAQLMNIPFENFDVLAGKTVSLEPEDIIDKLIYSPRGGYCYELNGLFAMALKHLQVPHTLLLARPRFYPENRPKTHMVIIAYLDEQPYLIDVAFGSKGPRAPIALADAGETIQQDHDFFRLTESEDEYLLSALDDKEWKPQYSFNLIPQAWIDFVPANYFNSNHPSAIFTQKPLVLIHTKEGRSVLFGDKLKIVRGDFEHTQDITDAQMPAILSKEFGIEFANTASQTTD